MRKFALVLAFGLTALTLILAVPTPSSAQVGVSITVGPPAIPVYAQPICPGDGYLWTPGYWAYGTDDYYWVPGTWVRPPTVGFLWTPGYWGFAGGFYAWHGGYWGPHVGFYGGINYGFGYGGVGFGGGEWRGGTFFYNRSVTNVNVTNVTNVYNRTVIVNNTHTSFNGPGGIVARPTPQEEAYGREPHTAALAAQTQHEHAASQNRQLFASENHGRPAIAATGKPGEFNGRNVQKASAAGEPYRQPKMSPQEARRSSADNRGGNRASKTPARNESARNGGNFNNRATARPEKHEARNNAEGNRGQMSSRDNPKHNSKPSKQEKQVQKKAEKADRAQAKAEQKRNAPE